MTDTSKFGSIRAADSFPSGPLDCAAIELWLAESAERALAPVSLEAITHHAEQCTACREKLAHARRGREWLLILKEEHPAPPSSLVSKIMARTSDSGAQMGPDARAKTIFPVTPDTKVLPADDRVPLKIGSTSIPAGANSTIPVWQHSSVVLLRRTLLEPRLALVAAMAFFSITLTLNLMGVRLTHLHAADLTPRNMRHAITRHYVDTNARVVRYYENLRIVYEVEARVQQLRRAAETAPAPAQDSSPRKRNLNNGANPGDNSTSSQQDDLPAHSGAQGDKHSASRRPLPEPMIAGPRMDAAFQAPEMRPLHLIFSSMRRLSTRESE